MLTVGGLIWGASSRATKLEVQIDVLVKAVQELEADAEVARAERQTATSERQKAWSVACMAAGLFDTGRC